VLLAAAAFVCLSASIVDGDTLRCANVEDANGRVRLARIDTPERGEAGFNEASAALAAMIAGREVTCELVDAEPGTAGFQRRDRYGRPVARCRTSEGDLGERMVQSNLAIRWP
jgi:endonuclease YncB( thermonuclease family)